MSCSRSLLALGPGLSLSSIPSLPCQAAGMWPGSHHPDSVACEPMPCCPERLALPSCRVWSAPQIPSPGDCSVQRAQEFPAVLPQTLAEIVVSCRRGWLEASMLTSCRQRRSRLATPPRASEGATTTPSLRSPTFRRRLMWPQVTPPMVCHITPLLGLG